MQYLVLWILRLVKIALREKRQTCKYKKHAKRSSKILEILHSNIWYLDMQIQDLKCFIYFIPCNKYETLDAFKVVKAEVEKIIKMVRNHIGEEYYNRYIQHGQIVDLFVKKIKITRQLSNTQCLILHVKMGQKKKKWNIDGHGQEL